MAKKLTTEEILAQARAQTAGDGGGQESAPEPEEKPAAPAASGGGVAAPKSTADILAAARAQAAGSSGGDEAAPAEEASAKPAAPAAGGAPKSTSDILAAARAQASGGGAAKPAAPAGGAPKSTADILAAARAQASGEAPAAKPAAAAPKAKAKAAAAPTGDTPSVAEMLEAVRSGGAAAVEARPAVAPAAAPVIPKKPPAKKAAPKAKGKGNVDRRTVLATLTAPFTIAWVSFAGASVAALLGLARFMMPNVLVEPPTKFKIGPPSDYPPGAVSTKWKAARGIWVVNTDQYDGNQTMYALSSVCTHLGCTPNWLEGEQKFKCPCHGSGFYITGINFEGPAPRPLERVGIRLAEDGMLEVDKSVKFQEELGQWEDATSSYSVV